ncbi:multiheme c-type cytochrome [Sedimenticola hydrogenitrophicus]|uniref:multiheme c-type cytochrome n=1 Tax=Sedimenticola hydrogenitrophicus TaxID=2967975 RepID=UPI002738426A|nr:multiheme c-type cytochrome [Sedimenticola hydrogenitrophicus]
MTRLRFRIAFICWALLMSGATVSLADSDADPSIDSFLDRHWQRPLPLQGEAPAGFSPLESSLDPRACGACHPHQFQDWKDSLHAHAMGPGLLGQLIEMDPANREEHQACLRCHAPLAEQAGEVATWIAEGHSGLAPATPTGVPTGPLFNQGLICTACHLRAWEIHGPPARNGDESGKTAGPHGGFNPDVAFESSRFCAACHQFESDGFALNGKLLENTFTEWRASPQAAAGQSCQSCHMPDRRHQWRGIHDKDTVLSGVEIGLDGVTATGPTLSARLSLTNSGVGHHFPTYVTPRVVMEAVQLDADGTLLPQTREERIIARQVSMDLSEELSDTRLAPGGSITLDYRQPRDPQAGSLRLRIRVEPDRFYRDFYQAMLDNGWAGKGSGLLRRALDAADASVFTLFEREIPLL